MRSITSTCVLAAKPRILSAACSSLRACLRIVAVIIGVCCTLPTEAAIIAQKDSLDFGTYQYEMGTLPSAEDLDSNSTFDFPSAGAGASVSGGILSMGSGNVFNSSTANQAWDVMAPTLATGYTLEIRLKVLTQTGTAGAMVLGASPGGTSAHAWLDVGTSSTSWNTTGSVALDSSNNTDDFHVFRVAQEAGSATYSVWRDGLLLSETLGSGGNFALERMFFGDGGGAWAGDIEVDYLRFTSGAFAPAPTPVPEPSSLLLLGLGALGLARHPRRRGRRA